MPPDPPRFNDFRAAMFSTSANDIAPPDRKSYVRPWSGSSSPRESTYVYVVSNYMWRNVVIPSESRLYPGSIDIFRRRRRRRQW